MIKVENLFKSFGHKMAVDDVSFHVRRGEVLGFIGPNVNDAHFLQLANAPAHSSLIESGGIADAPGAYPRLGGQQRHNTPVGDTDSEPRTINRGSAA